MKVRAMTYTPDFVDPNNKWIIEVKGYANDVFPLKWKLFKVKPKKQNPDFVDYHIQTTLRDKIHTISANLKRDFKSEEACIQRITYYVDIIHNRLKKIDLGMDASPTHKIYLNKQNYSIMERQLLAVCFESNGRYIASLSYEDFTIQKDISKEGL